MRKELPHVRELWGYRSPVAPHSLELPKTRHSLAVRLPALPEWSTGVGQVSNLTRQVRRDDTSTQALAGFRRMFLSRNNLFFWLGPSCP